jgi:hypothetical protein
MSAPAVVAFAATGFAVAIGVLYHRDASGPGIAVASSLEWKDLTPRIELVLERSAKAAQQRAHAEFDRWLAAQIAKADTKGGFLDTEMNYWNERLAAIKWGWTWLATRGDKSAADREHQENIGRDFASLVVSPEQAERELSEIADNSVRHFAAALGTGLEALRVETGASPVLFNERLAAVELVVDERPAAAVSLARLADRKHRDEAVGRLLEGRGAAKSVDMGPASAKVRDAIVFAVSAVGIGASVTTVVKGLGASSQVATGAGYVAVAVLLVAAAYDGFQHNWTYDNRRTHVRSQIEAGLRAFGHEALERHAGDAIDGAVSRLRAQVVAQAI